MKPSRTSSWILRVCIIAAVWGLIAAGGSGALAAGLLIPTDPSAAPLRILDHLVTINLDDQIALTTVNQTFENTSRQQLEATYVFPIPEGADLTDFRMTFNGKMVQGEVLEADKAREIYESIVRRNRDPGLIEFIGRRLLRARVFPIEPGAKTEIQVQYQQVCARTSDLWRYHYPLRTPGASSRVEGTLRFSVKLHSDSPLRAIWSPTHSIDIVRDGEYDAKAAFERTAASLNEDFVLLYDTEARDVGLSLVASKPSATEPGHFVLILAPGELWKGRDAIPQDYVFVIDTSGSMAGDKIKQAREALTYCVERLESKDRFSIVRFSTGFDLAFDELRNADGEAKTAARAAIERYDAAGGTNIQDALHAALRLAPAESDRPFVLVFITDGKGDQPREVVEKMLAEETGAVRYRIRLFPFGVGDDVNAVMLDGLASSYRGLPTYVQPGENLEHVLGDFFAVFSKPVLTDLALSLPDAGITEKFPPEPGDLYHGRQIVLAGQFDRPTTGRVILKAKRGGEVVTYEWKDVKFESSSDAPYVSRLWAGRKIAYLLDRIRIDGESQEKIDEVLALSIKYGIQTPYSSWLVAPEYGGNRPIPLAGRNSDGSPSVWWSQVQRGGGGLEGAGAPGSLEATETLIPSDLFKVPSEIVNYPEGWPALTVRAEAEAIAAGAEAGKGAVDVAVRLARLREGAPADADRAIDQRYLAVRQIAEQTYYNIRGVLVDTRFKEGVEMLEVKFASDAYFELTLRRPDLRAALAASRIAVILVNDKLAIVVRDDDKGIEKFDDTQRTQVFGEK